MENKIFYPQDLGISKDKIAEVINQELLPITAKQITAADLSDGFCQEMVNEWWSQDGPGDLWLDEATLSDEWRKKILLQFNKPKE